jgi:XRE family transcriptional regulator, regulator of sulfur utilization
MPTAVTRRVAARIVALREQRGMTQESLATPARIHRVSLANIERGAKQPTLDTLDRIARALHVSLVDLVK